MAEKTKEQCRSELEALVRNYDRVLRHRSKDRISEETVRSWINDFLGVFGWDVRNVSQVWQEAVLDERSRRRLADIDSTHKRPDYTLLNGTQIKTFLDAKSLSVDVFSDRSAAFQIRSYGWSAQVPCAVVSNFAQTAIYDTRSVPDVKQDASSGVIQIGIDEYLDKFDILYGHLWRGNVVADGLRKIYSTTPGDGERTLDAQFMRILSGFRARLAEEVWKKNARMIADDESLNYYVQVIMDRIIFIRVCEAKGIERSERLREFQRTEGGFWKTFRESCYMEFHRHYDGAMFERDAKFTQIELDDGFFAEFLDQLYYPSPYRFDVIPIMMLAKIYEEFLGKRLVVRRGRVVEEVKGEYLKTNGAVPTPEYLVRLVCRRTFGNERVLSAKRLFDTKILDPCCGSGVFLVACYDYLEEQFVDLLKKDDGLQRQYEDFYFVDEDGNWLLTIPGRRLLIVKCLFGIDVDEAAVEVTKMSLALKMLDGNCVTVWDSLGADGERILRDIAGNVKLGNTLVPLSANLTDRKKNALKAFDPGLAFPTVFRGEGTGFSHIVCNPPYVETKYFKDAQPELHRYLSRSYKAYEGKADLAVLFIERCMRLLAEDGRAGFIVQRRWFRTEYGRGIRQLINTGRQLETMVEFDATDLFPGRITYVAIMTLTRKANTQVSYCRVGGDGDDVRALLADLPRADAVCDGITRTLGHPSGDAPWNFDAGGLGGLYQRLLDRHGSLGGFPGLSIKDGIQALWKKAYHFRDVVFSGKEACGTNGFGRRIRIEKDLLRGVVYNREFYPFKAVTPDAWCLFPYRGASADAIAYSDLKDGYPLAFAYLESMRETIRRNVECRDGERWHTFTREHNHGLYHADKIIVPMTARDTVATYVSGENGLYMDNANVWFLSIPGGSMELMKAVALIVNSTVFSVLAKSRANPQSGGYYKFNKQFLMPVPFPSAALFGNPSVQSRFAVLSDRIGNLQRDFIVCRPVHRDLVAQRLERAWREADKAVEDLYGLDAAERTEIERVGRTVSRLDLLPRE